MCEAKTQEKNGHIAVAIDGPSGAGKSTLARAAAQALGFLYVDTGAIYRTIGCAVCREGANPADGEAVSALLPSIQVELRHGADGLQHMLLNQEDVTQEIRLPKISSAASAVSAHPAVRGHLLAMQRELAQTRDVVMDGRDIGTVVLPWADVKIFLTASPEVRARRRCLELEQRGTPQEYDSVLADLLQRDDRDMHRSVAPLRQAEDAVLLDTSELTFEESLSALLKIVREKI